MTRDEIHLQIKQSLKSRKVSFREISDLLQVSTAAVSMVSKGQRSSKRIAFEIARHLDVKPNDLWPGKYQAKEAL